MLLADLRRDFVNTWFTPLAEASFAALEETYAEMERRRPRCGAERLPGPCQIIVSRAADMRYVGQEHAVIVELPSALFAATGPRRHQAALRRHPTTRYGHRARRDGRDRQPALVRHRGVAQAAASSASRKAARCRRATPAGSTRGLFRRDAAMSQTPTYDRRGCCAGNRIAGPALVEEYALDDRRASRRPPRSRRVRRSRDRDSQELRMNDRCRAGCSVPHRHRAIP